MRRVIRVLNWFPTVKGRVWVDLYSLIALIRFSLGKPVDVPTLAVVLGTYAVSKTLPRLTSGDAQ